MVCWVAGTLCVAHTKPLSVVGLTAKNRHWLICVDATLSIPESKMNPKLKEIAWHATVLDQNGQEQSFDKEAFARMIVRECAGIAKQDGDILKEFGVE